MGGNDGGITFYVQADGKLCFAHNYLALEYFYVRSDAPVPAGEHFLSMEFEPSGKPDFQARQRLAGGRDAVDRRRAGRSRRCAGHHADPAGAGRRDARRCRYRSDGRSRLCVAVRVHRDDRARDRRRERRTRRRSRIGDEDRTCQTGSVAPADGSVLPFPPAPTASVAARTLQASSMKRRVEPGHLPPDAPNILIVLLDDVGFGLPDASGGPIHTPTLSRRARRHHYNAFHTTAICSPTRAALLTGRNHQRVGSGTIAERAVDFDGYTGVIREPRRPWRKSSAITATRPRPSASGTTPRPPRRRRWARSRCGRPAKGSVSTTSTASSQARRRSGNRDCTKTSIPSSRPATKRII